jgi:hypothetical protein
MATTDGFQVQGGVQHERCGHCGQDQYADYEQAGVADRVAFAEGGDLRGPVRVVAEG